MMIEDDYNARVQLGFLLLESRPEEDFSLTERDSAGTRSLRFCAAGALLLTCATALAAQASPQTSAGAAPTSQAATSKSAASPQKTHTATAASRSKSTGASRTASAGKHPASRRKKTVRPVRGQQKIDSERTQAIQEALIREHYLSGEATGQWTQSTEDALRRYQADHGWQSKTVPDSRALIKLGLGPSHDHLLNPESAMTTAPDAPRATSLTPASHSADPGPGVNSTTPAPADPAPTPAAGTPGPQ
jgi:peptidoglycan hydrolase-like protein with peptidoglycan-binding domain